MEIWTIIWAALRSVLRILIVAGLGYLASKAGILDRTVTKGINRLVTCVLTPCFLFTRVGSIVTVDKVLGWWPLLGAAFGTVLFGVALGQILGFAQRLPKNRRNLASVVIGFKNALSLPMSLSETLTSTVLLPLLPSDSSAVEAVQRAAAYVLFVSAFNNVLCWTAGLRLLQPPTTRESFDLLAQASAMEMVVSPQTVASDIPESARASDEEVEVAASESPSVVASSEQELPSKTGCFARTRAFFVRYRNAFRSIVSDFLARHRRLHKVLVEIDKIFTPPLIAVIVALFVGLIPALKNLFFGVDAPLATITGALESSGSTVTPLTVLTLGSSLSFNSNFRRSATLSTGIVEGLLTIIAGQIIMPCIGIAFLLLMLLSGDPLLRGDPVMQLAILLFFCSAPNISLTAMATFHGFQEQETATYVFRSYLLSVFSITASCVAFLEILPMLPQLFPV